MSSAIMLFVVLILLIESTSHSLPTSSRDSVTKFGQASIAYRLCLSERMNGLPYDDQIWTEWPKSVNACKEIEPWDWIAVEKIDQDDRGPLWFIHPAGHDNTFSMVSVGVDRRDITPDRALRNLIPQAQLHGVGVKFHSPGNDWNNFSSVGNYHNVNRDTCFEIEGQTPKLPDPVDPETPPTDIPESYIHFLDGMPLIVLMWIDGTVHTIDKYEKANLSGGVIFDANFRGYLIFDRKKIDAASKICQVAIRSRHFERYATNITLPTGVTIFGYPSLPLTKVCQHKRIDLALIIRRLVLTNPSFVPIRSEYHTSANNELYLNEFYINVANPRCIAKYAAKSRIDVEENTRSRSISCSSFMNNFYSKYLPTWLRPYECVPASGRE